MVSNKKYLFPEALNVSKKDIIKFGEKFAEDFSKNSPVDMFKFVERLKGKIKYVNIEEATDDHISLVVNGKEDFTITIEDFSSPNRNKFTLAQEVAHYILHSQLGKKRIKAKRFELKDADYQATWFATGLLMPEKLFKKKLKEYKGDFIKLSEYFRLPIDFIESRNNIL